MYHCLTCDKDIKTSKKQGVGPVSKHIVTKKHLDKVVAVTVEDRMPDYAIHERLLKMMLNLNIALRKIVKDVFKNFFMDCFGFKVHSRTHYRNVILPAMYKRCFELKMDSIKDCNFFIMLDETPDIIGRKIINIFIGKLLESNQDKPFLLNTVELDTVNSNTISDLVLHEVVKAVNSHLQIQNFRLFLTDGAPYCVKSGRELKLTFRSLKHVICINHNLHNFAETIRKHAPNIDKLISLLKKHYTKNTKLKKAFLLEYKCRIETFPVITRWGTWIKFAEFLYDKFQLINEHVAKSENHANTDAILDLMLDKRITEEFEMVSGYFYLPGIIKKLEKRELPVVEAAKLFKQAESKIKHAFLKERWAEIIAKNPVLDYFLNFDILHCKYDERFYKNAPLTTVEVERSFSQLNNIMTDKKTNMGLETLKISMFFACE